MNNDNSPSGLGTGCGLAGPALVGAVITTELKSLFSSVAVTLLRPLLLVAGSVGRLSVYAFRCDEKPRLVPCRTTDRQREDLIVYTDGSVTKDQSGWVGLHC